MATRATPSAVAIADRRRRALALRIAGATYDQIATELKVSKRQAYVDVTTELDHTRKHSAEQALTLRDIELRRLDQMQLVLHEQVKKGNHGAIDRALRISERRSKLLGLDAPAKQEITGKDGASLQQPTHIVITTPATSESDD